MKKRNPECQLSLTPVATLLWRAPNHQTVWLFSGLTPYFLGRGGQVPLEPATEGMGVLLSSPMYPRGLRGCNHWFATDHPIKADSWARRSALHRLSFSVPRHDCPAGSWRAFERLSPQCATRYTSTGLQSSSSHLFKAFTCSPCVGENSSRLRKDFPQVK